MSHFSCLYRLKIPVLVPAIVVLYLHGIGQIPTFAVLHSTDMYLCSLLNATTIQCRSKCCCSQKLSRYFCHWRSVSVFLPFTVQFVFILFFFKEAVHLLHTSERLRQSVWKNGDKKALTMCLSDSVCVCVCICKICFCQLNTHSYPSQCLSWGAEGLRGFRSLSLQHAEQTRLLCT